MSTASDTPTQAERPRKPGWKTISIVVAIPFAAALLYFSLRGIEWRQVWLTVGAAKPSYLVLACALVTVALFLRAFRWRILLQAEGPVRVPLAFWATSAGYFGNNFLPARAGELVRTFMIGAGAGLNNAYVLATALSERVADAIALVVISSLALLTLPVQPGWLATAARPFGILGLSGALIIAVLPRMESLGKKLLASLPLPHALRVRLLWAMEHGLRGIRAFHDPGRLAGFLGLTIVIWCLDAVSTVTGGRALGLDIPLPVAFLLIAGLGLGSALPSTPGYVGIYQFVAVSVLTPFGFSRAEAIAYILVAQALQYVVIGFWGALGLVQYRRLKPRETSPMSIQQRVLWLDQRPMLVLLILTPLYILLLQPLLYRPLWFDELHTYYIAQAPTIARFIEEIRRLDLNPPLIYGLVRMSLRVFGDSEIATRLPSVLGYFAASAGMFWFVCRRVGALWAAAAVALFWYSPFFYFATEARPYGILIGSFGLTLVAWDNVVVDRKRKWALAGVAIGTLGMMLSHVLAPFSIMPFCVGESVRCWRRRKIDWALWVALLAPLLSAVVYVPLMQSAGATVFPKPFQGSIDKLAGFYVKVFFHIFLPLIFALIPAFIIAARQRHVASDSLADPPKFAAHDLAFLVASLLPPAILNLLTMHTHTAFYDRYGLTSVLTMYILVILFVAYETKGNRLSGAAAALVICGSLLVPAVKALHSAVPFDPAYKSILNRTSPDLPLVSNNALGFLAMDHYEDPVLLARLYCLVDHDASIRYADSTLLEGLPILKQYFPIRANVQSYSEFVAEHRHFLVLGSMGDPGTWLLPKLQAEGATIIKVGDIKSPWEDAYLYDVTLAPAARDGDADAR